MSIAQHPNEFEIARPTSYVEERPWGKFELLVLNQQVSVKVITVAPGQRLSLQTHECRDEWWQMLDAGPCVEMDGVLVAAGRREGVDPARRTHRVSNPHNEPGRFLEIALGGSTSSTSRGSRTTTPGCPTPTRRGGGRSRAAAAPPARRRLASGRRVGPPAGSGPPGARPRPRPPVISGSGPRSRLGQQLQGRVRSGRLSSSWTWVRTVCGESTRPRRSRCGSSRREQRRAHHAGGR